MNREQIENREIWENVKGSEKLLEIYTYYPTLHDATIRNISLNFEKRELLMIFDYSDFIQSPGDSVATRFAMRWREVQKADFNWYAEDLLGMKFSKAGQYIKTKFEDYGFGFDGELIAREVEVTDVEIAPEKDKNNQGHAIKFSLS